MFCDDPKRAHFSLRRRIENDLPEQFGFGASPIKLEVPGATARARGASRA